MAEARILRASTLFTLLSTSACFSHLPNARPLARPLHLHRNCNSCYISRSRSAPLCAIAVGRGTAVDEDEGQRSSRQNHDHDEGKKPLQTLNIDATGLDVDMGESSTKPEWYGVQEDARPRPQAVRRPWSRTGSASASASAAAAAAAAAAASAAGKKKGEGKGKSVKDRAGSKSGGKATGRSKGQVNPSIGKSNLDAIIAQTRQEAKKGAFAEAFGGERVEPAAAAVSKQKAEREAVAGSSVFAGDAERAAAAALDDAVAEAAAAEAVEAGEEVGVPYTMAGRWKKRVTFVARTVQIWAFLFHVLIKLLRQKLVQRDEARMSARRRKLGRYLCRAFLKLGPTFIKIGQLLSTRVDLLSTEYIEELRQLQDDVPGFGGKKAVKIIERELGAPISELFDSFNTTSLAAASLGQVHEAWLDGNRYAVKVQRPGLKGLFEVDLKSIGALAAVLDRFDPKLDGASRDWGAIFRESSRVLYEEVDYTREGKNAERFSEDFKGTDWIKAPSINWSRSTSKVLCMEFVEGIKISDVEKIEAAGIDRPLLSRRTAECYLAQLCRHGFFHCDPHPGNLAVNAANGGTIIFYDFGMMDELSIPLKRSFVNLIFGIYGDDVKEVVDSLEEMDVIRKGADRMTVERVTRFYLGEFQTTLQRGGKYINELDADEEKALMRRERAQIGQDLFSGTAAVPLQFPASFTFVFRAFTTLDGIGKTLDPAYDLTKIFSPYLKELLDLKDGSTYVSVLKGFQKKLGWRGQDVASLVQSPRRVQHVNDVVTKLEQGDLKLRVRVLESEAAFARLEAVQGSLTAAVMATLLLNTGSLLANTSAAPAVFGSRAMFAFAGFFGLQVPIGYLKVWQLNRQAETGKGFR